MMNTKMVATRFCMIVLCIMSFLLFTGPTISAKPKEDETNKHKGWENVVEKFIEHEKTPPDHVDNPLFQYVRDALEVELFHMVPVGEIGVTYQVPSCSFYCGYWETNDAGTAYVMGGYLMATTETTYELWYYIRTWAMEHGYAFQNAGTEGSEGLPGALPTENSLQPVTSISFRDMVVWLNALSEYDQYEPVYRTLSGEIIRNSTDAFAQIVDHAVQTSYKGYRLPTNVEWEMAAKWKNDVESTHGSIYRGGRYWTPHNYSSGATGPIYDTLATNAVAWHMGNSGGKSQPVGLLNPNDLGIYDMSGNMWELTFSLLYAGRQNRGGGWENSSLHTQVGVSRYWGYPEWAYNNSGFRFVINM